MRTQTTRTIAGRVNSDGTPFAAGEYTSRKTATGTYAITFPTNVRFVAMTANLNTPAGFTLVQNQNVLIFNASVAAVDAPFSFAATVAA